MKKTTIGIWSGVGIVAITTTAIVVPLSLKNDDYVITRKVIKDTLQSTNLAALRNTLSDGNIIATTDKALDIATRITDANKLLTETGIDLTNLEDTSTYVITAKGNAGGELAISVVMTTDGATTPASEAATHVIAHLSDAQIEIDNYKITDSVKKEALLASMVIESKMWQFDKMKKTKYFDKFASMVEKIFLKLKVNPHFLVENRPTRNTPLYVPDQKKIILSTDNKMLYHQQILFQLSHEIIHQLIFEIAGVSRYNNNYLKKSEIFCSAFALYMIKQLGWNDYFNNEFNSKLGPHAQYNRDIQNVYLELEDNFDQNFYKFIDKAIDELMAKYKVGM